MPSRRLRSRQDASAADRISDLPEPIITEILNHLPTRDAVATSVLSKSWRRRWTEVTTLDVEATWDDHIKYSRMVQYVEFVEMVFLNMTSGSIRKFRLRWNCKYCFSETWFSALISAIPRSVKVLKVLDLASDQLDAGTELPSEIFTCKTLEVLRLDGRDFKIIKLPDVICLPKLAELELNRVFYDFNAVSELISSCPVLQSLTIKHNDDWRNYINIDRRIFTVSSLSLKRLHLRFEKYCINTERLRIDAPSLECLVLHDSASKEISILQGLTSVNELHLDLYPSFGKHLAFGILEMLSSLRNYQ